MGVLFPRTDCCSLDGFGRKYKLSMGNRRLAKPTTVPRIVPEPVVL